MSASGVVDKRSDAPTIPNAESRHPTLAAVLCRRELQLDGVQVNSEVAPHDAQCPVAKVEGRCRVDLTSSHGQTPRLLRHIYRQPACRQVSN